MQREESAPPGARKRTLLGCSFPFAIAIGVLLLALFVVGFVAGPIGKSMVPGLYNALPSFLKLQPPAVELPAEEVATVFGIPLTNTILASWLTVITLVLLAFFITRTMRLVPRRWQMLLEFGMGSLLGFCQRVAGEKHGRQFFPIVSTIFLFVLVNAWFNLIPGFGSITIMSPEGRAVPLLRGANTDINTPLALALVSFAAVLYFGLKSTGVKYLRNYFNFGGIFHGIAELFKGHLKTAFGSFFTGVINAFIGLIELLSMLTRIISFTFRLFGNMTAGEILLLMAAFLIPFLFALPFYGLELLVGFIQALIFAGLTLVFLTLAVSTHGEEHH